MIPAAVTASPVDLGAFRERLLAVKARIQHAIIGHDDLIIDCLAAIMADGHVLLEGVPGLGKTTLVRTIAESLDLSFGRIQCTPDLMPADILGTHIIASDEATGRRQMRWEPGPVFRHIILVDEINRATPKTQAGLLEAMQERQVTAGTERHPLPAPFFVLATQNPVEMEGTFPLPEAQLDRFAFKLIVPFPGPEELLAIAARTTAKRAPPAPPAMGGAELMAWQDAIAAVPIAEPVARYAADLVLATHPQRPEAPPIVRRAIAYGASPRAVQTLIRTARVHALLAGRTAVALADLQRVARPALRHRLIRNFEGEADGIGADRILDEMLATVPGPAGA